MRHLDGRAEACAEGVEEGGDLRRNGRIDFVDDGVGVEVEVVRVATPEAGRHVDAHVAVGVETAVPGAEAVGAGQALAAVAAGDGRLDADAVARLHSPAPGGDVADLGDAADGLVAWHDRKADRKRALVLLVVGAADAAGLNLEEGVVGADIGKGQLPQLESAGSCLDDGAGSARQGHTITVAGEARANASRPYRPDLTKRCSITASASRTMSRRISPAGLISCIMPTPWPAGMNVLLTSKDSVSPG